MSALMDVSMDLFSNLFAPIGMEISFFIFFALGYFVLRLHFFPRQLRKGAASKVDIMESRLHKTIETEVNAGHMIAAVKAWRAVKARVPVQLETLKLLVQAMLEVDPNALVTEITGHMADHNATLCTPRAAAAVLDTVARSGQISVMEELHKVFSDSLRIRPSAQVYEALIGGYAAVGDEKQVAEICSHLWKNNMKLTARGYSLTIKGFLKNSLVDASLKQILDMHHAGFTIPPFAITQLVRVSCEAKRGTETFEALRQEIPFPPEAMAFLLEDCLKRNDPLQAKEIEKIARSQAGSAPLTVQAYDALLKLCVLHSDLHALELFEEMQKLNVRIGDRLCNGLLSRCAETKFLRFAEEIVKFLRRRGAITISVYSTVMKVYAYAGMYDKACDLYEQILADGLEPDAIMYGCLMKFAVECGRTDLSRELFAKVPNFDIQHYMSLIRAAGRDKDIQKAFQVLQKLKETGIKPDLAAYNCVLDVCVSSGDLARARELMAEMRTFSQLDVITYNTFLKGFCAAGDIRGAKELLAEMERDGLPPNDVSYNCLINAAVSKGLWQEAWNTVEMMQRSGVKVDCYTISIMMKALKKNRIPEHVGRSLALLDNSGLDVCSDEVLLNTVLETCIRHRDHCRLQSIVDSFSKCSLQPGVHTYGSLIKACSILKRVDKSWELWKKMVDERAMPPNSIVLGCMLDALVCNERVEDAVSLFQTWREKVPPNTIMYSTLVKGFANSHQASRAMDIWQEMRASKMEMNTVVYNGVIDAHARLGLMDEVSLLVQSMEPDRCTPDAITYSTIVKGYCITGNLDKAFEVFRSMQQNQTNNDSACYNTLLDGCVRSNRMDLADLLLEDMEKFSIAASNFTLGILVKMYGRRKQLDKAFRAVEELPKKHHFRPNTQVKTCLMCACLNNHDLDAAFKVFAGLRSYEKGADWKTYTCMISGLLRHGRVNQAVDLVKDAYGLTKGTKAVAFTHGQKVETDCLEQLLRALVQQGQMVSVGLPLLNQLRAANVPISGKLMSTFTSSRNTEASEQPANH
mmetsp:Transcript_36260/g.67740  ORF Transcript_36260/g.67740 Transcript_36260/m.67740 type:complete len:1031 (+) Transcript_36260:143-3235(+)